jgi:hypothetical protein
MTRLRLTLFLATAAAAVATLVLAPVAPAAPAAASPTSIAAPVTGTLPGGGTFAGTFTPTHFFAQNGQLMVTGTLTGTLTDALGNVIGTVTQTITTAVTGTGSCQILDLTLGPLDLNLLGLVVHLDTVHLNITAQSGPGNLLGNLLCAVAHLLDNGNATNGIANLLNNIIARL